MTAVNITMRHSELTPQLQRFAEDKLTRIEKLLYGSPRIELIVDHAHEAYQVEMIVHSTSKGALTVAHDESGEVHAAIDGVIDKVGRQLVKLRGRRKDHHRGERLEDPVDPLLDDSADEPSYEEIVDREIKGD